MEIQGDCGSCISHAPCYEFDPALPLRPQDELVEELEPGRPLTGNDTGLAMEIKVLVDAEAAALEAARVISAEARSGVAARGRFVMAVSGGRTPWQMLRALAGEEVPWEHVHIVQVDERVAPAGHPDRNLTHLLESLLNQTLLSAQQIHAMPVEDSDFENAARRYASVLEQLAGKPSVLDLVHLGLGPDGHTASLIPNDPVLDLMDRDVAVTGIYQQRRRITLTYPILNRARRILWLVTGAEKAGMLARLRAADGSIPAGRVNQQRGRIIADVPASAGAVGHGVQGI